MAIEGSGVWHDIFLAGEKYGPKGGGVKNIGRNQSRESMAARHLFAAAKYVPRNHAYIMNIRRKRKAIFNGGLSARK